MVMELRKPRPFLAFIIAGLISTASGAIMAAHAEQGIASVYTDTKTASGARFSSAGLTAAHKTLPFGTRVKVTNKSNGRAVVVTVTDRGPYRAQRIIDMTPAGAHAIGMDGLAPVVVTVLAGFEDRFSAAFPVLEQAVPSSEVGRRHVTPPKIRKHRYRRHRRHR